MPQFDILTLGAQISGLLVIFSFFYYLNIKKTIPLFIQTKKFRHKKLKESVTKLYVLKLLKIKKKIQETGFYLKFL